MKCIHKLQLVGEWKDDRRCGNGTFTSADDAVYSGKRVALYNISLLPSLHYHVHFFLFRRMAQ